MHPQSIALRPIVERIDFFMIVSPSDRSGSARDLLTAARAAEVHHVQTESLRRAVCDCFLPFDQSVIGRCGCGTRGRRRCNDHRRGRRGRFNHGRWSLRLIHSFVVGKASGSDSACCNGCGDNCDTLRKTHFFEPSIGNLP